MKRLAFAVALTCVVACADIPAASATTYQKVQALAHAGTCNGEKVYGIDTTLLDGNEGIGFVMVDTNGGKCMYAGAYMVWTDCDGQSHTSAEYWVFNQQNYDNVNFPQPQHFVEYSCTAAHLDHVSFRFAGDDGTGNAKFDPPSGYITLYQNSGTCAVPAGGNAACSIVTP